MPLLAEEEEGIIRKPAVKAKMFDELGHEPVKSADIRVHEAMQRVSESFSELGRLGRQVDLLLLEAKEKGYTGESDTRTSLRMVPRHRRHEERIAMGLSDSELQQKLETRPEHLREAGMIRILRLHPGIDRMFEETQAACKALCIPESADKFWTTTHIVDWVLCSLKIEPPTLKVADDIYFHEYLRRDGNSAQNVNALTHTFIDVDLITRTGDIRSVIYIRESRIGRLADILGDIEHEINHPFDKLTEQRQKGQREGFNEYMAYVAIQEDKNIPEDTKNAVRISKAYRLYVVQTYLLEQIIGRDRLIVGYRAEGEDYLRQEFDRVAGSGSYERIYGGRYEIDAAGMRRWIENVSDEGKVGTLHKICDDKYQDDLETQKRIASTVRKILDEAKL